MRVKNGLKVLKIMLFSAAMPLTTHAIEVLDFQSARTLQLSGGGRGGAILTDTIHVNPSMLGFQQVQGISGTYDWLNRIDQRPASTVQRVLNATVIDGKNPYVVAGASYTRRPDLDMIHVGMAKQVMPWLSFGLLGKRFVVRETYKDQVGEHTGYDGGASVGMVFKEIPIPLQIGLTADNLLRSSANEKLVGGRKFGSGIKASMKDILSVYADYVRVMGNESPSYSQLSVAGELSLGGDLFARGGIHRMGRKGWSVGGSWMAPKLGVNYGYLRRTDPKDGWEHAVTLDIYI